MHRQFDLVERSRTATLALCSAILAIAAAACSQGPASESASTSNPSAVDGAVSSPVPTTIVVAGLDMIKASDEADMVGLADLVAVVRPVGIPDAVPLGADGIHADYFLEVDVVRVLKGEPTPKLTIQWLGVAPDIGPYIADPDLEPLDKVMPPGQTYVVFLFLADRPGTFNIIGHLQGILRVGDDGRLEIMEGGLEALAGVRVADLQMLIADLHG
jgi:hypothetical protein